MAEKKKVESIHTGHRSRIRERFRSVGLGGFSEHEALELLLTFAIPQRDVNPLAHELIRQFGSLANVLEADESELRLVPGVGENAALILNLMPQLFTLYSKSRMGERPVIETFAQARRYCASLFYGAHDELAYMISLDRSGRVIHPSLLSRGTVDEVMLHPRQVVETALRHHAYGVLFAHNHPGGDIEPSHSDYEATSRAIVALKVVGIRVVDHIILAGDRAYSMMSRSQTGVQAVEELSYIARSGAPAGVRGTLRTSDDNPLIGLDEEDLLGRMKS